MDFDKMEIIKTSNPTMATNNQDPSNNPLSSISNERDPFFYIEALRHQEISSLLISGFLIKLCDSKFKCPEEILAKLANLVIEKFVCDSPIKEILQSFDSLDFYKKLCNNQQFDYEKFLIFCRFLCSSDKQGFYLKDLFT